MRVFWASVVGNASPHNLYTSTTQMHRHFFTKKFVVRRSRVDLRGAASAVTHSASRGVGFIGVTCAVSHTTSGGHDATFDGGLSGSSAHAVPDSPEVGSASTSTPTSTCFSRRSFLKSLDRSCHWQTALIFAKFSRSISTCNAAVLSHDMRTLIEMPSTSPIGGLEYCETLPGLLVLTYGIELRISRVHELLNYICSRRHPFIGCTIGKQGMYIIGDSRNMHVDHTRLFFYMAGWNRDSMLQSTTRDCDGLLDDEWRHDATLRAIYRAVAQHKQCSNQSGYKYKG